MRIIFLNPNTYLEDLIHPPIGIALLATICAQRGWETTVYDLPILGWNDERAVEEIVNFAPDFLGITTTTKTYAGSVEVAKLVKKEIPEVNIVMGGPHPTFAGWDVLTRCPYVDFTVAYEGEHTFPQLIEACRAGMFPQEIPGVGYRSNDRIILTPPASPIKELDDLPMPRREFFPIMDYLARDDETTVLTARGCPNRCAFCSTSRMGRSLRCRSPQKVLEEVEYLLEMGFCSIFFSDDTFTSSLSRVENLCNVFKNIKRSWRWTCNMRLQDAKSDILGHMSEAGCYRVFVGVESSSKNILGKVNKLCPTSDAVELCKLIQSYDIEVHASFLLGLPGETEETIIETLEHAKRMQPDMISFNVITPYPGTELYNHPEKYGLVMPNKFWFENKRWFDLPVCGTEAISPERLKQLATETYLNYLT